MDKNSVLYPVTLKNKLRWKSQIHMIYSNTMAKHTRRYQNALLRLCSVGDVVHRKLSWIFLGDSIILMFLIVDPYPSIITFTPPPPLFFSPLYLLSYYIE